MAKASREGAMPPCGPAAASRRRSPSGRSSSASPQNPSSAAAPSATPGAAPPPPATSSWTTTPASPHSPSSRVNSSLAPSTAAPATKTSSPSIIGLPTPGFKLSVCNPVTREHAHLVGFSFFSLLGMYLHHPTGEYQLLLHRMNQMGSIAGSPLPEGKIGCYIFVLGSDQQPRYIQGPKAAAGLRISAPSRVCDSLHWFPVQLQSESRLVLVFDTTTESFRQMRAPVVPTKSDIFEMDGTLGIYSYNDDMKVVDIWVLQDYEGEVWKFKYRVELPVREIRGQFERECSWDVGVVSADGDVFLLVSHGGWMFYVNTDGELVDSFHRDGQHICAWDFRFKQTLVPHNFFMAFEVFFCERFAFPLMAVE